MVTAKIPNLHMPTGYTSKFSISECTFVDHDIGDALTFEAKLDCGQSLPKWIKFDRMTRTFSFRPPVEQTSTISIRVVAADFEGLTVSTDMKVSFFSSIEH